MRLFTMRMSVVCTALLLVAACGDDDPAPAATPTADVVDSDATSDATEGDALAADVTPGDTAMGDTAMGDTAMGDTAMGDTAMDDVPMEFDADPSDDVPMDDVSMNDVPMEDAGPSDDVVPEPAVPTWDGDVQAIIQASCGSCHGTKGGWSASSYADSQEEAYSSQCSGMTKGQCFSIRIKDETMPTNTSVLGAMMDSGELETLDAWIAGGMPEN